VKLRHATFARNLSSILRAGLLCSKSQGKLPVVWLGSAAKTLWAAAHVVRRHGPRDVPPERIRGVITFGELSRSPVPAAAGR
jgi:hypothetical protein